ncbi:MAG: hypothetical protein QT00_C0003G0005 [archaeon GW2011_AR5]|nr:MAG: hypothetical protein QT00_C0003G0005 [archaeon GW2011_AR5]
MAKTILNIKTDPAVKHAAQRLAKEIGVPLSTIVNAKLKQFILERGVELSALRISKTLERELKTVDKDFAEGKNLSPAFASADTALAFLHSRKK